MAYSVDFRECVIRNIDNGMSWREAAKTFKISSRSISRWINNLAKMGGVMDAPRKKYKAKKIGSQRLLEELEKTPDATLEELASHFNCWPQSVQKRCVKLGITRKKNHTICRKK